MQNKIICLVGPSGSGKTTIAKELEKMGYNIIHSYTTREPRELDEWGHTFITNWYPVVVCGKIVGFENNKNMHLDEAEYIDIYDMIAYKEIYGDHYFATKEQYQDKGTSIYVVDPEGAKQVRESVKDADVVTVFLQCDEDDRARRMAIRMSGIKHCPFYKISAQQSSEIFRRIEKDKEIFKVCKCNYVVDANKEVKEVLEDVVSIVGRG